MSHLRIAIIPDVRKLPNGHGEWATIGTSQWCEKTSIPLLATGALAWWLKGALPGVAERKSNYME